MVLPEQEKRLAIFAYYDEDGIIDDYIPYLLEQVGGFCEKQIIIVNGTLTKESESMIAPYAAQIIYRENRGYDISGYRQALLSQKECLNDYDEILFYNQTIFGPVCSLQPMFSKMAQRNVDFWGLTRHKGAEHAAWDENVAIQPHVQSFFFAVRSSLFLTPQFLEYWQQLPPIETYWDAVGKHEIVFTKHFNDLGFQWDVYVETADLEVYNDYPLMGMPKQLLKERGCPFFKRKNFIMPRYKYTTTPQGQAVQLLYDYVKNETEYPIRFVVQNMMRTSEIAQVTQALTPYFNVQQKTTATRLYAIVISVVQEAWAKELLQVAQMNTNCLVLFASEQLANTYQEFVPKQAQIAIIDTPAPKEVFTKYWPKIAQSELLLYLSNDVPRLIEQQFFDATSLIQTLDSLANPNCASILQKNQEFGVLIPVQINHQETLGIGLNLPQYAEKLQGMFADAGLKIPKATMAGLASRGGMFFAQTKALEGLTNLNWEQAELFAGEYPLWELIPPLAAQANGYLTGFAATPEIAFAQLSNVNDIMQDVLQIWSTPQKKAYHLVQFRMKGIRDFYYERRFHMTLEQAFHAKLSAKQKLWICLQIILKPETFAKLKRLLGKQTSAPEITTDTMD